MTQYIEFGTKAETLSRLRPILKASQIPALYYFQKSSWAAAPDRCLDQIQATWQNCNLIIRSSAEGEDSKESSHAGAFLSIGQIPVSDRAQLTRAINEVIASYKQLGGDHQILVQEQLTHLALSGVLFTRDIDTLAPYYIVNFDEVSGSTDSVTSGRGDTLQTIVRFKQSPYPTSDPRLEPLYKAAQELERVLKCDSLDIEFALTAEGGVILFQVRPIVTDGKSRGTNAEHLDDYLRKVYKKLVKRSAAHPGLHGKKALFSVMTDWNPAEMIGIRPRPLALTLYRELITDSVWAHQREHYGYKDLRGFPLMISFLGLPYIDVRVSFNSFVPRELDEKLSGKLVDYYIDRLRETPADHDKVEFNIVFSCYYLNLPQRLTPLLKYGFSELELDRIKFALLNLTNKVISPREPRYQHDIERLKVLDQKYSEINNSDLPAIDKIFWLLEDCKRFGTLPFAGLARAGFIAVQFLRSIVDQGLIGAADFQAFLNSLNTVANQMAKDSRDFAGKSISKSEFLERYGHLRPGTYDILSPRYDSEEGFNLYFSRLTETEKKADSVTPFQLTDTQRSRIKDCLVENGLLFEVDEMFQFCQQAIEGREYAKFVFTRHLSQVLRNLEELGARYGISKEEMSFVDIKTVRDCYMELTHFDLPEILKKDIAANREIYTTAQLVKLPQLIAQPTDIYDYSLGNVEPNYVSLGRVTSVIIQEEDFPTVELQGKIVFIRSADPGYDWIFSRGIAGLVTMYGGANSHMAIRCAELKIPAVIGCGEQNFSHWSKARMLEIDCANRLVNILAER